MLPEPTTRGSKTPNPGFGTPQGAAAEATPRWGAPYAAAWAAASAPAMAR
jgi:hypothetical protein